MGDALSKECGCSSYVPDPMNEQRFLPTERKEQAFSDCLETTVKHDHSARRYDIESSNALTPEIPEFNFRSTKRLEIKVVGSATMAAEQQLTITSVGSTQYVI
jgi:hypothetical protein